MRKQKVVACLVMSITASACGEDSGFDPSANLMAAADTRQDEIHGGTALTVSEVSRSGIVETEYEIAEGYHMRCTGSVVSTSAFRRETWVLTAAHCFPALGAGEVESNHATLRQVFLGTAVYLGEEASGTVYMHPAYDDSVSPYRHDMALVHFPFGVAVETPTGATLREYFRPVSGINTSEFGGDTVRIFGSGRHDGGERDWLCNRESAYNKDDTVRFILGEYETGSHGVYHADITFEDDWTLPGDSGGPHMTALGHGSPSTDDYLNDGVITGATHGTSCYLGGALAVAGTSTYAGQNHDFLVNTAGDAVHVLYAMSWKRTCWKDWCYYDDHEQAALTMTVLASM